MREFIVNPQLDSRGGPVTANATHTDDPMRRLIVAKLQASGVPTINVSDDRLLEAYKQLVCAPVQRQLDQANARLAHYIA